MGDRPARRGRGSVLSGGHRRRSALPALGAGLALLVVVVLAAGPGQRVLGLPEPVATAVVDLTELLAAVCAAVSCAVRAATTAGTRDVREAPADTRARRRRAAAWVLFAASTGSWALGQLVWTVDEVVRGVDPTPSVPSNVAFVACSVLMPVAMTTLGFSAERTSSRVRVLLDGLLASGALFVLQWRLVLGPAVRAGSDDALQVFLTTAAPVGDVAVVTAALLLVARHRLTASAGLLTGGAALMALADIGYAVAGSAGDFDTGGVIDVGWTAAMALFAAAGVFSPPARAAGGTASSTPPGTPTAAPAPAGAARRRRPLVVLLPYLPLAAVMPLVLVDGAHRRLGVVELTALGLLTTLLVVRQALVVTENADLAEELRERSTALARLAFTDPLTGTANRAAFTGALEAALDRGDAVVAAFCDLDAFKAVNDVLGHAVGDALLVAVARRLERVVRTGDVVARLGGDEFALLVTGAAAAPGAAPLRKRLLDVFAEPFAADLPLAVALAGTTADQRAVVDVVSVSVGVVASVEVVAGPGRSPAEALLHEADQRMYASKRLRAGRR